MRPEEGILASQSSTGMCGEAGNGAWASPTAW